MPRPWTNRRHRYSRSTAPRKAKMRPPAVPIRSLARIPPMIEPPRPSPIVAYQGIGSGPGSERRARAPTMKPQTINPMMKISTDPSFVACEQLFADVQDPLQDRQPGRRGQEGDRTHEQP